jgi:hypothetical protein
MGVDGHAAAILRTFELHRPIAECEEGVVVADADAGAGIELGTALADQDHAGLDDFACVALDAEPLGIAIAAVLG